MLRRQYARSAQGGSGSGIISGWLSGTCDPLPLEDPYGVHVRSREDLSLYFGKKPSDTRPNRSWDDDLLAFVDALDSAA